MSEQSPSSKSTSTANRPDLDWSQVRETILMLHLSMAQIELALHDSASSVSDLSDSFTTISATLTAIRAATERLPDHGDTSAVKAEIAELGSEGGEKVGQAIIAFQFYDRLSQRLSHVCRSLDDLGGLVSDSSRLYNPTAWVSLQALIRSKYVTEEDRRMFDTLMATQNVQLALDEFIRCKREQQPSGDIELF
jgi:hypothetical protein